MAQELTPNQVVAWNLWQERKRRGWDWKEVSDRLAEHGLKWTKATYYAVEASRLPESQGRRFSADELMALALVFRKPIAWLLIPPEGYTMVLNGEPLYLADLLLMGLQRDLHDLTPLADRLREVATAIETFEEERQPVSGAERIVEQATAPSSIPTPPEYEGEIGELRRAHEVVDAIKGGAALNRQWRENLATVLRPLREAAAAENNDDARARADALWQAFELDELEAKDKEEKGPA